MTPDGIASVDDVLRRTGLLTLGDAPSMEAVESALRSLADALADISPLRREVVRAGAVRALAAAGIRGAARLVDAALATERPEPDAADVGRWATHGPPVVDLVRTHEGLRYLTARQGDAVGLVADVEGRETWPAGGLPWPAIPDAGAVLYALEAGACAPVDDLRELVQARVVLPEPADAWASLGAAWTLGTYLLHRRPYFHSCYSKGRRSAERPDSHAR